MPPDVNPTLGSGVQANSAAPPRAKAPSPQCETGEEWSEACLSYVVDFLVVKKKIHLQS